MRESDATTTAPRSPTEKLKIEKLNENAENEIVFVVNEFKFTLTKLIKIRTHLTIYYCLCNFAPLQINTCFLAISEASRLLGLTVELDYVETYNS